MKPTSPVSRTASYFPLDISQSSQQALRFRQQTGNTHSAGARRAKRRAYLPHLPERLSKAPRPGLVSESRLAETGLHAHARCRAAGSVVRSVRPRRHRGTAASQPRSTSRFSQELQGAERIGAHEAPGVLRRDLQPTEIKATAETRSPSLPGPTPPIRDGTRLEPK